MGRAIVRQPQAFLMDEPLSNLDAKLRVGMRASLAQLHQQLGVTTVYVTHDQVEAMTLGQRVAVMRDGRILQVDTPQTLYERPRDLFVAGLHRLAGDEPRRGARSTATSSCSASSGSRSRRERRPGRTDVERDRRDPSGDVRGRRLLAAAELPTIDADVVVLEELGSDAHVFFRVDATRIAAGLDEDADEATDLVSESWRAPERAGRLHAHRPGSARTIRLAVDPSRFHFFDAETGHVAPRLAPRRRQRSAAASPRSATWY